MKRVTGSLSVLIIMIMVSCSRQEHGHDSIKLSPQSDSILTATEKSGNLVTDSIMARYRSAKSPREQLFLLNQLLENKKLYTPTLANDLVSQSKKLEDTYNALYANLNLAVWHTLNYRFDSSHAIINRVLPLIKTRGYDSLAALAYYYRANNHYMVDEYKPALVNLDSSHAAALRSGFRDRALYARALKGSIFAFQSDFRASIRQLLAVSRDNQAKNLPLQNMIDFSAAQSYLMLNQKDSALFYLNRSIRQGELMHDKAMQLKPKATLVSLYILQGDYVQALKVANEGLALAQETGDKSIEAFFMNSVGDIYKQRWEFTNALNTYRQALKLAGVMRDDYRRALLYINIADLMNKPGQTKDSSLYYARKGLFISQKTGDQLRESDALAQIGNTYFHKGLTDSAIVYFNRSLAIARKIDYRNKIAFNLNFLVEVDIRKKNYAAARQKQQEIALLGDEDNAVNMVNYHNNGYELNKILGDYKTALMHFEKFKALGDSTNNAARSREISKIEYEYKAGRLKADQEKKDLVYKARQREKEEEIRRSALVRNFLLGGLLILLVLLFLIFRSLVANRRAKKIIEEQKREVELSRDSIREQKKIIEEKNTEIVQSITYAEGIQRAILASESDIKKIFPQSFLLFIPKDIVAGDFYFFEKTASHIFYAAADCTGHGVPGALVSMICSNALRRCVNEYNLTDPGKILDKARELVIETFEKSGKNVKDGMDISLVSMRLDTLTSPQVELLWAGAHNPFWYTHGGNIVEVTANKQPIGLSEKPGAFVTHRIALSKGDMFYLFTDGYADQFGGPRGKKLKYKTLQELLLACHQHDPQEQVKALWSRFSEWKGGLEQVDDVCVIGVRI